MEMDVDVDADVDGGINMFQLKEQKQGLTGGDYVIDECIDKDYIRGILNALQLCLPPEAADGGLSLSIPRWVLREVSEIFRSRSS